MSGTITTFRGYEWSQAPQDLIQALRVAAFPVPRIDEGAVSDRELIAADVILVALDVPALPRHSFTLGADQLIAKYTTAIIANIALGGALTTQFVVTDQYYHSSGLAFIFDGYVPVAGQVKLIARNYNFTTDLTLLAGTKINYILV